MKINYVELAGLDDSQRNKLTERPNAGIRDLIPRIVPIIEDVKSRGDLALSDYTLKFDGARMTSQDFRVQKETMNQALKNMSPGLRDAIETSIANITKFHKLQKEPEIRESEIMPGIIAGEKNIHLQF